VSDTSAGPHVAAAEAQPPAARWAANLAGLAYELAPVADGVACLVVAREVLHETLRRLRDDAGFAVCTFVTAIDHFPREPRFQMNWQLLAPAHKERLRVRCTISGQDAHVPTCTDLWPGANWMERECFDMFGIRFDGHPDLRRLLMPDGYEHHPLRKEFPHKGIEPDKLYREWDRRRREGWSESR
jgi:NADH-quinone oxidoreductase subunit C